MTIQRKHVIDLLQVKRREDPEGFREYLPDVDDILPELPSRLSRTRIGSGLTERELAYHREGLSGVLRKLNDGTLTSDGALEGLQHCAALIRDDSLPYTGEGEEDDLTYRIDHEVLKALVRAAIGKSPGSYKSKASIPVGQGGAPVLERVSVIMGVHLELDRNGQLVSIAVNPGRFKQRGKLMKIVGVGSDPEPDVAARHDLYLAVQDPHGNS